MDPRFPRPKLRDEFRSELRARLLTEAQTALAPKRGTAWGRGTAWASWLRPALAVGLAAIVLLAGAGTAAADSLPGDPGFALKRAVEDLEVALTFDDVQRVQLLAQLSDRRLAELQKVAEHGDKAPTASEEYAAAIARFRAAVDALKDAAPQDKADRAQDVADAAREKHDAVLDAIEDRVPEKARAALERARETEHKDSDKKDKDRDSNKTERPEPSRSAAPTRASQSPRATDRPETTRPATPRPSGSVRPSGSPEQERD